MSAFYSSDQIIDKYTKSIVDILKDQLENEDETIINQELLDMRDDLVEALIKEIKEF